MKISLIHPSRGRAFMAHTAFRNWIGRMGWKSGVEHILSLDKDDPTLIDYQLAFRDTTNMIINDNSCVVEATNHAARCATGDILVYLSDDFECPLRWNDEIIKLVPDRKEFMIWVDDTIQGKNTVLTIPIMSRGLYEELDYFWHPGYKSMWVDVDLWYVCNKRGVLVEAHDLKFEHRHYSVGKAKYDRTYAQHDNPERQEQGWKFFCQRKAENFMTYGEFR